MDITRSADNKKITFFLNGRLDASTTPKTEEEIYAAISDEDEITLDFINLSYISSAGLRLLIKMKKDFAAKADVIIINANETIKEIFGLTGFSDILNIK